jgi:hypothetical protein
MPSTSFLHFDEIASSSGADLATGDSNADFLAGTVVDQSFFSVETVNDTIRFRGVSSTGIPSGSTINGLEFRVLMRGQGSTMKFTLKPGRQADSGLYQSGTATEVTHSSSVGTAFTNHVVGDSTDLHSVSSLTTSNLDTLTLDYTTTENSSSGAFRFHSSDGTTGLSAPTVRIHYTEPVPDSDVNKWNKTLINTSASDYSVTDDDVGTETDGSIATMDGQTRTGGEWSPSNGGGTQGSNNLTGWVNGSSAIDGTYWKSTSNPQTPRITTNQTARGWSCGPSTSSNGTSSSNTGPRGGVDTSTLTAASGTLTQGANTSVSDLNSRFLFTETSSIYGSRQFVMRSRAYNWSQSMTDTSNPLILSFFCYAHGFNCGTLSIYIHDDTVANDDDATWLANVEFRTTPASGQSSNSSHRETKARVYTGVVEGSSPIYGGPGAGSSSFGGVNTGTENVWGNYYNSNVNVNSSTALWRKIEIAIPNIFKVSNQSYYIYFVHEGSTLSENNAILESGETSITGSNFSFLGDLSLDNIKTTERIASTVAKRLNNVVTQNLSGGTKEINLTEVP